MRAARFAAVTMLAVSTAGTGAGADVASAAVGPAAEGAEIPDIGGVYTTTNGGRWAIEVGVDGTLVMYAVSGGHCVEPGTLVSSGVWNGSAFDLQTPLYDLDPETGRCLDVAPESSADRIVVIDHRALDYCSPTSPCLRMVRPVRYRVQFSAWIPHDTVADPYLPRPVEGLDPGLLDLVPDTLDACLAADQVESLVPGQGHVGLVEPLLAVLTVEFTHTTLDRLADMTWEAAPMSVARTVAGNSASGAATECTQDVTLPGAAVGRASTFGETIVMQLHAPLGIVPARRTDISASEAAVLERLGCDGAAVSCDPHEQALGIGQIDGWAVLGVDESGALAVTTSTNAFPSFGLTVRALGRDLMTTVLQDSSCYDVHGLPGVLNMVEMLHLLEPRGAGRVASWPDDPCEPRRLQGDDVSASFDGTRSELVDFVLAARYADGRR